MHAWFHVSMGSRAKSLGSARGYGTRSFPWNATPRRNGFGSIASEVHGIGELRAHAAVDHQRLAGDVRRQVRRQEQDRGGDVGRLGDPAERRVLALLLPSPV